MSFINSLSTGNGEGGINGVDGARVVAGDDGADGIHGVDGVDGVDGAQGQQGLQGNNGIHGVDGVDGADGADGAQGQQGTNAGSDPSFNSVTVAADLNVNGNFNCNHSLQNNGYNTTRSGFHQLNNTWRDIEGIGRKFTGIVVISAMGNDLSSGVFAVANNSNSVNGVVKNLSVQGDYYDDSIRVAVGFNGGVLQAIRYKDGYYKKYIISFFGFH